MFAAFATAVHLAMSRAMIARNSSGVFPDGTMDIWSRRSLISGSFTARHFLLDAIHDGLRCSRRRVEPGKQADLDIRAARLGERRQIGPGRVALRRLPR